MKLKLYTDSMQSFPNLLTPADTHYVLSLPDVDKSRERLDERSHVDFNADIPEETRARLSHTLGLDITSPVPMRWIRGDSVPHVDHSWDHTSYDTTFLVYINDSDGLFFVGDKEYPIVAGQGYSFKEGLVHGTRNTTQDRLLIGPFSERQQRVGVLVGVTYWRSAAMDEVVYQQTTISGTLLSAGEINTINRNLGNSATITIPVGQEHIGWAFSASYSYGISTLNGVAPSATAKYPIRSAFDVGEGGTIALFPLFSPPRRVRRWTRLGKSNWPRPRHPRSTLSFIA